MPRLTTAERQEITDKWESTAPGPENVASDCMAICGYIPHLLADLAATEQERDDERTEKLAYLAVLKSFENVEAENAGLKARIERMDESDTNKTVSAMEILATVRHHESCRIGTPVHNSQRKSVGANTWPCDCWKSRIASALERP